MAQNKPTHALAFKALKVKTTDQQIVYQKSTAN